MKGGQMGFFHDLIDSLGLCYPQILRWYRNAYQETEGSRVNSRAKSG